MNDTPTLIISYLVLLPSARILHLPYLGTTVLLHLVSKYHTPIIIMQAQVWIRCQQYVQYLSAAESSASMHMKIGMN